MVIEVFKTCEFQIIFKVDERNLNYHSFFFERNGHIDYKRKGNGHGDSKRIEIIYATGKVISDANDDH